MGTEKSKNVTASLRVGGMTCVGCENAISRKLSGADGIGIVKASYREGVVVVDYDADKVTLDDISAMIRDAGYEVTGEGGAARPKTDARRAVGMLIIIAAIYIVMQQFGILNFFAPAALAGADTGYWLMFVIGLTTSAHCVAMCGGINLSQCLSRGEGGQGKSKLFGADIIRPPVLYNLGRVISYTAAGFAAGALGSAFTLSINAQGVLKLIAGAFMVIMGITMLDLFPGLRRLVPKMPVFFANKGGGRPDKTSHASKACGDVSISKDVSPNRKSKGPLIVGLLNGLMPCGPLQAAQIYALSTGSPLKGAMAMALFALGTAPLMFGLGAFGSAAGKKTSQKVMTAGAVAVAVLGLCMLTQSWNLFGLKMPAIAAAAQVSSADSAVGSDNRLKIDINLGPQIVRSALQPYAYPSINVEPGRPVRWIIDAPPGTINGCNNRFVIREYGIEHTFKPGENVIEFTPVREGRVPYTCWMGMIPGTITVARATAAPESGGGAGGSKGSESARPPRPKCCLN